MENKTVADFLSNNSYNYIVDIRNGVFHKKNSHCLNKISVDSWHGTGSNPMKNDYTPCPKCFGKPHKKNEDTSTYNNTNMQYSTEHRLIDGNYSYRNNIIARCHYINHRGYLTKNLIKKHKCIEKSCSLFEKLQPKYWIALEDIEQAKKSKRADRKAMKQLRNDRDVFIRETLEDSGCAYITSIKENPNLIEIIYIYDKRIDFTPEINFLRNKLGKRIKLQARIGTKEAIEKLIKKPRRDMKKVTNLLKAPKVGHATKKRLASLGIFCVEDLFGCNAITLYKQDCKQSNCIVNRRYLSAYKSAIEFANNINPNIYSESK